MRGRKILAVFIAVAMVMSAIVIINKITDFDIEVVENTKAWPKYYSNLPMRNATGIDRWQAVHQGSVPGTADYNRKIINGSNMDIEYSTTAQSVTFNGTACANNYYHVYKPFYGRVASSGWKYNVSWQYANVTFTGANPTKSVTFDRAGLWLVVPANINPQVTYNTLDKINVSNMSYYNTLTSGWVNITGWFWVNSSSWNIQLSKETARYGRNDSLTVTVKDSDGDVVDDKYIWVDIWMLDNSTDYNDVGAKHIYHHLITPADDGVWDISNLYDFTRGGSTSSRGKYGRGVYQFVAYADYRLLGGSPDNRYSDYIYGTDGTAYNENGGYNLTFGDESVWSGKFSIGASGTILDSAGSVVTSWTGADATYRYDSCGPFDPPEYLSEPANFTVLPGVPSFTVVNDTQFWNDSDISNNNRGIEVNITVKNYDNKPLRFISANDVTLYNKSNKPTKQNSVPIDRKYYNVSVKNKDNMFIIKITPRCAGGNLNRWGYNQTVNNGYVWAQVGKIYVVVANSTTSVGNHSWEEWNGTAEFKLTSASYQIAWVDDDGTDLSGWGTNDNKDGVIPTVPRIDQVPIWVQFKVQSNTYQNFGDTWGGYSAANSKKYAAQNISVSGNTLFTGSIDTFPGFTTAWYGGNTTGAWSVPIIPTMSQSGGSIKITANAWNRTLTKNLAIGKTNGLWQDGCIVNLDTTSFPIDQEDQLIGISVKDAQNAGNIDGSSAVSLMYLDTYTPDYQDPLTPGTWSSPDYTDYLSGTSLTWNLNKTQQTTNQTNTFGSGVNNIRAPRNVTVYVDAGNYGYGYAIIKILPANDFQVNLSYNTMIAGKAYDNFYINTTMYGTSDTPSTENTDKGNYLVKIFDENGDEASSKFSGLDTLYGTSAAYSISSDGVYCTTPGTYSIYSKNHTHDSTGHNGTIVVEAVEIACDKAPFIWRSDYNISATFTILYNGAPINGSLVIDNMSSVSHPDGSYNKTWINTSFNGESDQQTQYGSSKEIEYMDINKNNDGKITIHDITAQNLSKNSAFDKITFWFKPLDDDGDDSSCAYAKMKFNDGGTLKDSLKVKVPTVTFKDSADPNKAYIPIGRDTRLTVEVTGRGEKLGNVFVHAQGSGITGVNGTSGTTGSDLGQVPLILHPTGVGNVTVSVGNKNRVLDTEDTVIIATGWILDIAVSPSSIEEESDFTVTVTKEADGSAVNGAVVKVEGITGTKTTGSDGKVTFTAPEVTSDRDLTVTATAEGFAPEPDTIEVRVIYVPSLVISADDPYAGCEFEIVVAKDTGDAVIGADVTFNGETKKTKAGGVVTFTAPDTTGEQTIKASFSEWGEKTVTVTVQKCKDDKCPCYTAPGSPGFELLTIVIALGVAFILLRRRKQ